MSSFWLERIWMSRIKTFICHILRSVQMYRFDTCCLLWENTEDSRGSFSLIRHQLIPEQEETFSLLIRHLNRIQRERQDFCPITIVFSFDKALPLTKPLHADAVYDHWRLLLLERLVQLQSRGRERGERGNGGGVSGRDKREEKHGEGGTKKKYIKWGWKDWEERRWKT